MLAPRNAFRRNILSRNRTSYICPSCQFRAQSSSLPPKPSQDTQSDYLMEDIQQTSGHDSETQKRLQQQLLLHQVDQHQPMENHNPVYRQHPEPQMLHGIAPSYPEATPKQRPKATGEAGETFDRPFNAAAAAFVTGLGLGFAGAAFLYFFSGAYRIVTHASEERRQLAKRRAQLFAPQGSARVGTTFDERREWFEMCARNYAAFVPGTHAYLAATLPDIRNAQRTKADGSERVDEVIRSCAAELQKLSVGAGADLMKGREAWRIVHEHLERIVELAEEGRNVPLEVRQVVQKRLDGLKKIGTRVGRDERRALEEQELAKAVVAQ